MNEKYFSAVSDVIPAQVMFRDDIDERMAKYHKDDYKEIEKEPEIIQEELLKTNGGLELSSTPPDEAEALRERIQYLERKELAEQVERES